MKLVPIHPFPARMAPEIILESLGTLGPAAVVADPMVGSGTVMRACVELGLDGRGFDLDPLAVLMTRAWTRQPSGDIAEDAANVVSLARAQVGAMPLWHYRDPETDAFARFWFEPRQHTDLSALSTVLFNWSGANVDLLRLALSRTIITKEKGASVARDTSHSRPHRVFFGNDYDVFEGFLSAAKRISERLRPEKIRGSAIIQRGDARSMPLMDGSVDAVITSPPYLNAIDYMRGHRMALIWLGFTVGELRNIRSTSIGAEVKGIRGEIDLLGRFPGLTGLSPRNIGIVNRYASDIVALMREVRRVLKPNGEVLLVVGNSVIKDVLVSNADINVLAAHLAGLTLTKRVERDLPSNSRYLPIAGAPNALTKRMRTETVLTFSG